jgi:hypothetical protein
LLVLFVSTGVNDDGIAVFFMQSVLQCAQQAIKAPEIIRDFKRRHYHATVVGPSGAVTGDARGVCDGLGVTLTIDSGGVRDFQAGCVTKRPQNPGYLSATVRV